MRSALGPGAIALVSPFSTGLDQVISVAGLEQALGYATMGERFLAFLCDASVETLLIGVFLVLYLKSSLDSPWLVEAVVLLIPAAYMTLAEFFFHGTIGKRLLRIQLRADLPELGYPPFFKILFRESVGKLVSGIVLGIGYLAGGWHPKHKTWADRMAGTVVVRIGFASGRLKIVLAIVLVCAYFWVDRVRQIPSNYKKNVARIETTEGNIDDLHAAIFGAFFTEERRSSEKYREAMAALRPKLDEYDRQVLLEREIIRTLRKLANDSENKQLDAYEKIIGLRQEIAALVRIHVQFVLAFDRQKQARVEFIRHTQQMMRDINSRNTQINQIGADFIPRPIEVTWDGFLKGS